MRRTSRHMTIQRKHCLPKFVPDGQCIFSIKTASAMEFISYSLSLLLFSWEEEVLHDKPKESQLPSARAAITRIDYS